MAGAGSDRSSEPRCPRCGALVAADAAWCGQCYEPLGASEPPSPPPDAGPSEPAPVERREPAWPCPVCGGANAIELEACATCGTPFARAMQTGAEPTAVAPRQALTWSLVFPGLGHRLVGRPLDGLARGVLFAVTFGMALVLGVGGARAGPTGAVFVLFLLTSLVVYAGSAIEAHRLASGGELLVSSRVLLWVLAAVIMGSVIAFAFAAVSAGRGATSSPQAVAVGG